jgi:hypothetical protein
MKGAWTYNLHPQVNVNKPYLKHLTSATEGLAKDFHKVCAAPASHVGILLVDFETPRFPISASDIDRMKHNAGYGQHAWSEHTDSWPDGITHGSKVSVWFWWRALGSNAAAGEQTHPPSASVEAAMSEGGSPATSATTVSKGAGNTGNSNLSFDQMVERLKRRIIANHNNHGENWYGETYYVECSRDCGTVVAAPEPAGLPDRKNPTRRAFAQTIRRVIPMNRYDREVGLRMVREITAAILEFHRVTPPV